MDVRKKVDFFVNKSESTAAKFLELCGVMLILLICIIYVWENQSTDLLVKTYLFYIEQVIGYIFLIEYLVRWWAKYFSIKYLFTPFAIVDLLSVLPVFFYTNLQFIRILRLLRILRIVRWLYGKDTFIFGKISGLHIRMSRIIFTLFCLIFISAGILYEIEGDYNIKIKSFFDAIYLSIISIKTVGYGDIVPVTDEGRIFILCVIFISSIVIPWQIAMLGQYLLSSNSVCYHKYKCSICGLEKHDNDARFCKSCGEHIYT